MLGFRPIGALPIGVISYIVILGGVSVLVMVEAADVFANGIEEGDAFQALEEADVFADGIEEGQGIPL